jgi:hypothetical protein
MGEFSFSFPLKKGHGSADYVSIIQNASSWKNHYPTLGSVRNASSPSDSVPAQVMINGHKRTRRVGRGSCRCSVSYLVLVMSFVSFGIKTVMRGRMATISGVGPVGMSYPSVHVLAIASLVLLELRMPRIQLTGNVSVRQGYTRHCTLGVKAMWPCRSSHCHSQALIWLSGSGQVSGNWISDVPGSMICMPAAEKIIPFSLDGIPSHPWTNTLVRVYRIHSAGSDGNIYTPHRSLYSLVLLSYSSVYCQLCLLPGVTWPTNPLAKRINFSMCLSDNT